MAETQEVRDKVVLVGLNSPVLKKEENADEDTMEELSALVETAGGETVGIVLQNRPSPDPRTFIGEGKVAEVQLYCENTGATMVIFDNDLSPSQMRVLTELLGIQPEECTPDGMFSLTACRCVGACGLAPVLTINDDVYGRLTPDEVEGILAKYSA